MFAQNPTLAVLALLWVRVLPLGLVLGALTRGVFGWTVSLSLTLALTAALSLGKPSAPLALPDLARPIALGLRLLREFGLGSLVALALLLPLAAAVWAARFSEVLAGPFGLRAGPVATLYGLSAGFACLSLGLHRSLVIGLHQSLTLAPVASPTFRSDSFGLAVAELVAEAFALALALGLPLVVSCLLVEAGGALLRRVLRHGSEHALLPLGRPLFFLVAGALLWPLVSQIPGALRIGTRLLRELTLRVAS